MNSKYIKESNIIVYPNIYNKKNRKGLLFSSFIISKNKIKKDFAMQIFLDFYLENWFCQNGM